MSSDSEPTPFTPINSSPNHNNSNTNNNMNKKTPTKKRPAPSSSSPCSPTTSTTTTTPTSTSKSTSSTSNKRTKSRTMLPPIPTTLSSATASDLLILRLRDEEQAPWSTINQAWKDLTGMSVGGTTLRARYNTMKKNFVVVDSVDEAKILQAKKDIEGRLETEKWRLIAEEVVKLGGGCYPGECLRRYVREMEKGKKEVQVGDEDHHHVNGGEKGEVDGKVDGDKVKMKLEEED
ncbi:hypothetical protein ASPBRDRAFT_206307 [Aspergillus brasiliensis CBS 101740]|uniref:Myb-like domain-containing protein n=1 Tax=Aspergillus brasiliensis (strain CBS 101740 / IMI 381727 / IBT 21946) TaxID=767769 RepID=A0A1L9UL59_ASPBC|nr:hypothetical protein ASPBRDRAFT_206307 [Aspergillus brasiliensis CBS 101740]